MRICAICLRDNDPLSVYFGKSWWVSDWTQFAHYTSQSFARNQESGCQIHIKYTKEIWCIAYINMNIYILIHIKHLIEYPFYQISDTRLQSSAQEDPSDRSWLQKGDALGGWGPGGAVGVGRQQRDVMPAGNFSRVQ